MSAHNAIDYFERLMSRLDEEIRRCREELKNPQRDPGRLAKLFQLLEKRNRALRQLNGFRS